MQENRLNLGYLKLLKWLFFTFLALIIFIVFYFPNYAKLKRLHRENAKLIRQISNLEAEIKNLENSTEMISKDPYFYEKLARDQLGAVREGEIVVDIKE